MRESILQKQILVEFGALPWLRLWRNNTGQAWTGNQIIRSDRPQTVLMQAGDVLIRKAHPVRFGLPGSSDIDGIAKGGQRIAIENKSDTGKQSTEQEKFQAMIERMGGKYILARSVEDVYRAFNLKE